MDYLASERSRRLRADPRLILPGARTALALGMAYPNPADIPEPPGAGPAGRVAAYAWGIDYHQIIPPRLEALSAMIDRQLGRSFSWRGYTDTGPILERDLGQQAGLGWIGKNTCLIHPRHGSYFLLSELVLEADLEPDEPVGHDFCGSCRRCIEACPTQCILPDRTLDASRCISYQTIENKGEIPEELRPQMGDWVFGCDVCQAVCPWNLRFADLTPGPGLEPQPGLARPDLRRELHLTPEEFNRKFRYSPVRRPHRRGYLRNVAVALGNAGDPAAVPDLAEALRSEPEPLVRGHAAWALGKIGGKEARQTLQRAIGGEKDVGVVREIRRSMEMRFWLVD